MTLCITAMVSCGGSDKKDSNDGAKGGKTTEAPANDVANANNSQRNEEDVVAKAKAYQQRIIAADMKGHYDIVEMLSQEAENWLKSLSESDQEKVFNALMEEVDSYEYSVPDSSAYGYDDYSYGGGYDYGDDYDDCNYNDADDYSYDYDEEDYEDYEDYDDFEW